MKEDFSGGYIAASSEANRLFFHLGYSGRLSELDDIQYLSVYEGIVSYHKTKASVLPGFRLLYINNGEFSWDKPSDIKQICDNPDVNSANQLDATTSLDDLPLSSIAELKQKFRSGKYDCYERWIGYNHWTNIPVPTFQNRQSKIVLVLKEHSYIADAAIENPDVDIWYKNKGMDNFVKVLERFLEDYNEETEYTLYVEPRKAIDMSIGAEAIEKFSKVIEETPSLIFAAKVHEITNALAEMLIDKNAKYGNSALEPKRIFSSSDAIEQINVRIDDKLSRIANQNENDDEDAELDLMGYLILKRIAKTK